MKITDYPFHIVQNGIIPCQRGVYVLHFDKPFHHAKHYVGYSTRIEERLELHRTGQSGAVIMKELYKAGIGFAPVLIYPDAGQDFERYLKSVYKNTPSVCPTCNPKRYTKQRTGTI